MFGGSRDARWDMPSAGVLERIMLAASPGGGGMSGFFNNQTMGDLVGEDFNKVQRANQAAGKAWQASNMDEFANVGNFVQGLGLDPRLTKTTTRFLNQHLAQGPMSDFIPEDVKHAIAGPKGSKSVAFRSHLRDMMGHQDEYGREVLDNTNYTRILSENYGNMFKDDPNGPTYRQMQQYQKSLMRSGDIGPQTLDSHFENAFSNAHNAQVQMNAFRDAGGQMQKSRADASGRIISGEQNFINQATKVGQRFEEQNPGQRFDARNARQGFKEYENLMKNAERDIGTMQASADRVRKAAEQASQRGDAAEAGRLWDQETKMIAEINDKTKKHLKEVKNLFETNKEFKEVYEAEGYVAGHDSANLQEKISQKHDIEREMKSVLTVAGVPGAGQMGSAEIEAVLSRFAGHSSSTKNLDNQQTTADQFADFMRTMQYSARGFNTEDIMNIQQGVSSSVQGSSLARHAGSLTQMIGKELAEMSTFEGKNGARVSAVADMNRGVIGQSSMEEKSAYSQKRTMQAMDSDMKNVLGLAMQHGLVSEEEVKTGNFKDPAMAALMRGERRTDKQIIASLQQSAQSQGRDISFNMLEVGLGDVAYNSMMVMNNADAMQTVQNMANAQNDRVTRGRTPAEMKRNRVIMENKQALDYIYGSTRARNDETSVNLGNLVTAMESGNEEMFQAAVSKMPDSIKQDFAEMGVDLSGGVRGDGVGSLVASLRADSHRRGAGGDVGKVMHDMRRQSMTHADLARAETGQTTAIGQEPGPSMPALQEQAAADSQAVEDAKPEAEKPGFFRRILRSIFGSGKGGKGTSPLRAQVLPGKLDVESTASSIGTSGGVAGDQQKTSKTAYEVAKDLGVNAETVSAALSEVKKTFGKPGVSGISGSKDTSEAASAQEDSPSTEVVTRPETPKKTSVAGGRRDVAGMYAAATAKGETDTPEPEKPAEVEPDATEPVSKSRASAQSKAASRKAAYDAVVAKAGGAASAENVGSASGGDGATSESPTEAPAESTPSRIGAPRSAEEAKRNRVLREAAAQAPAAADRAEVDAETQPAETETVTDATSATDGPTVIGGVQRAGSGILQSLADSQRRSNRGVAQMLMAPARAIGNVGMGAIRGVGSIVGGTARGIGQAVGGVLGGVGGIGMGALRGVGNVVGGTVGGVGRIAGGVLGGVGNVGMGVARGVGSLVGGVAGGLSDIVSSPFRGIGTAWSEMRQGNILGGLWRGATTTVGGLARGVGRVTMAPLRAVGHVGMGLLRGVGSVVGGTARGVGSIVGGVARGVGSVGMGLLRGVGGAIGGTARGVGTLVGGAVRGVGGAVGGIARGIGSLVGGVGRGAWNVLSSPFRAMGGIGASAAQGAREIAAASTARSTSRAEAEQAEAATTDGEKKKGGFFGAVGDFLGEHGETILGALSKGKGRGRGRVRVRGGKGRSTLAARVLGGAAEVAGEVSPEQLESAVGGVRDFLGRRRGKAGDEGGSDSEAPDAVEEKAQVEQEAEDSADESPSETQAAGGSGGGVGGFMRSIGQRIADSRGGLAVRAAAGIGGGLLRGNLRAISTIGRGLASGVGQISGGLLRGAGNVIGGVGRGVGSLVGGIAGGIGNVLASPFRGIGTAWSEMRQGNVLGGLWRGATTAVGGTVRGLGQIGMAPLRAIGNVGGGLLRGAGSILGGVGSGLWSAISSPFRGAAAGTAEVINSVRGVGRTLSEARERRRERAAAASGGSSTFGDRAAAMGADVSQGAAEESASAVSAATEGGSVSPRAARFAAEVSRAGGAVSTPARSTETASVPAAEGEAAIEGDAALKKGVADAAEEKATSEQASKGKADKSVDSMTINANTVHLNGKVSGGGGPSLMDRMRGLGGRMSSLGRGVMSRLKSLGGGALSRVKSFGSSVASATRSAMAAPGNFVRGIGSGIASRTKAAWSNAKSGVSKAWGGIKSGAQAVGNAIATPFRRARDFAKQSWSNTKSFAKSTWSRTRDATKQAWNKTKTATYNTVTAPTRWAKAAAKKTWSGVKSGASRVGSAIASPFKKAWSGIKSGASRVWSGIKSGAQAVGNVVTAPTRWAKAAAGKAWGGIKSLFGGGDKKVDVLSITANTCKINGKTIEIGSDSPRASGSDAESTPTQASARAQRYQEAVTSQVRPAAGSILPTPSNVASRVGGAMSQMSRAIAVVMEDGKKSKEGKDKEASELKLYARIVNLEGNVTLNAPSAQLDTSML